MRWSPVLAAMWLACVGIVPLRAQDTSQGDLVEWRAWYRDATTNGRATEMAARMTKACGSDEENLTPDALAQGFLAVAHLMLADEAWNPLDKLGLFNEWKPQLEAAIALSPGDADLAFLRLGVQTHVPDLLKYNGDLDSDRLKVENALASGHWRTDPLHAAFVRDFLMYLKSL